MTRWHFVHLLIVLVLNQRTEFIDFGLFSIELFAWLKVSEHHSSPVKLCNNIYFKTIFVHWKTNRLSFISLKFWFFIHCRFIFGCGIVIWFVYNVDVIRSQSNLHVLLLFYLCFSSPVFVHFLFIYLSFGSSMQFWLILFIWPHRHFIEVKLLLTGSAHEWRKKNKSNLLLHSEQKYKTNQQKTATKIQTAIIWAKVKITWQLQWNILLNSIEVLL